MLKPALIFLASLLIPGGCADSKGQRGGPSDPADSKLASRPAAISGLPAGRGHELAKAMTDADAQARARRIAELKGRVIEDIEVRGVERAARGRILKAIGSRKNEPLDLELVTRDIRAIWELGGIREVYVDGREGEGDEVILGFHIEEYPRVDGFEFSGNRLFRDALLRSLIRLETGRPLDMTAVRRQQETLRDYYRQRGHLTAVITARVAPIDNARIKVIFVVDEGVPVTLGALDFVGNRFATDKKLGTLARGYGNINVAGGTYVREMLDRALLDITSYYYDNGYINARVGDPVERLSADKRSIRVQIKITEGDQFRVGETAVQGWLVAPGADYLDRFQFKKGDIFSRRLVVNTIDDLREFHRSIAKAEAYITPLTQISTDRKVIDITLEIAKQ